MQTLLTKEVVLWNHGYLAMPQVHRFPDCLPLFCYPPVEL